MKTAKRSPRPKALKAKKVTPVKMKTKAKTAPRLGRKKMKLRTAKKPVARTAVHLPPTKKMKARVLPIPISAKKDRMDERVFNDSREYDRRVFVRFDAAGKELVKAAAGESGLSPYIAFFAAEAATAGKTLIAKPVTTTKEAGVFARFESPAVKKMVANAASECKLSLSAYAAHFAVEAARAGRKMPSAEKEEAAS